MARVGPLMALLSSEPGGSGADQWQRTWHCYATRPATSVDALPGLPDPVLLDRGRDRVLIVLGIDEVRGISHTPTISTPPTFRLAYQLR